jgi:hypothetical protein
MSFSVLSVHFFVAKPFGIPPLERLYNMRNSIAPTSIVIPWMTCQPPDLTFFALRFASAAGTPGRSSR